jgi:hypothetical protein
MISKTFRAATVHDDNQGVDLSPPHPLAHLPRDTSTSYPWVARTLSRFTSQQVGRIASDSVIIEATKFMRPHKSRMHQYKINDFSSGPTRRGP